MRMVLIVAAVPLGNPADASARLRSAIESAEVIAAEDSRRFHRLASDLATPFAAKVVSFFEGNERERHEEILEYLRGDKRVLLVSDAGMPTISDPGFRLIREAIASNIKVEVLPGPTAVTTAIALSGLPTDRFTFEGFLPRTQGARTAALEELRFEERTMVFFEAPHRIVESLEEMARIFGSNRDAALCREMTKTYEEVVRKPLGALVEWATTREVLGEITLVVSGISVGTAVKTHDEIIARVRTFEAAGMERKEAIAEVAREFDLPKRVVYASVVEANKIGK